MKNIEKADKALERVSASQFLEGRKCSFLNGYCEKYRESEINITTWYDLSDNSTWIMASCFNDGWIDKNKFKVTSKTTVSEIMDAIINILWKYRHISGN